MRLPLLVVGASCLLVPVLEIWVLILLTRRLGLGLTVGVLLLSGVIGFWVARWQGWRTLARVQHELAAGRSPSAAVVDGVLILFAALLLIIPGLVTDVVAFLLLLPPVRCLVRRVLLAGIGKRTVGRVVFTETGAETREAGGPETVEGRVVSVEDADGRPSEMAGGSRRLQDRH